MSSNHKVRIPARSLCVLAGITLFSVGFYLIFSKFYFHVGFPLDDAWIHQTYARNLGLTGEWAFLPGHVSGGSTSPLWSIILAMGYRLGLAPFFWTFFWEALMLWGLAVLGESSMRALVPYYHPNFPWVGAVFALEWHLVWSSVSGMETLLFALLVFVILVKLLLGTHKYFSLGLLIGLSVWVRPDGITLLAPAVLIPLLVEKSWVKRLRAVIYLGFGFLILAAFYSLFNLVVSGSPLPMTFYAKQAEYASAMKLPFILRFWNEAFPVIKGIGIILLPGIIYLLIEIFRTRKWAFMVVIAWFIGFLTIYAWKLPVSYQYGRYVIPAMPVFFLLGLIGMVTYIGTSNSHFGRLVSTSWKLVLTAILISFWALGAAHYVQDVAVIESEMVATAEWVSINLPSDALIAAHDIGALGYFGRHDLVDLAGLISPEVIPFIRDEDRLKTFLNERGVDYLIIFPDWYEHLAMGLIPVYSTGAPFAPALGEKNMTVYRWSSP